MEIELKILIASILFLITIVAGIFTSHKGRPLNQLLFNIHKLSGLTAIVFTAIILQNLFFDEFTKTMLALTIIDALFVIGLFVTGALLSRDKPVNLLLLRIHNITTVLALVLSAYMVYRWL
ncbi:MAG: hypothetical protein K9I94_10700 [Bacteroidales bacterium]|nr:hypothetical protein [Bacteroidales bacterium]